ncbi:hypothetical protein Tco_0445720 [Tanacetum coccineum]
MIQPSSSKIAEDEVEGTDNVPGPSVPRKSTRTRKAKSFGSDFQLYLVEGTRDKTLSQREYCFIIEEDPRTLSEAMDSRDVAFWKEAVQSEIDSIMHNDTWELTDLPPGCKALGFGLISGGSLVNEWWVFFMESAISWDSKKQTCITSSTMKSEFVALAAAGNEAEWLRNLIYEIPLWPKPISTISYHSDRAADLLML